MNFPVFDLHCDTAGALIGFGETAPTTLDKNDLHIDLERASTLVTPSVLPALLLIMTKYHL